ncbi:hypothetical protein [Streptomyces specialis]|uniref:hypothetical protein n=1 Tax=Streptomyces specialis TaxID=498367 RepID=UPI00073EE77F|nr:hypothetical protein [Streptomyces specialis]
MTDPLDRRLKDLARDLEPVVVLAGPEAARRRGERRRAHRRAATAAVSPATAAALLAATWQLAPWREDDTAPPPAATGGPTETPTAVVLPPAALPGYEDLRWTTASESGASPQTLEWWRTECEWEASPTGSAGAETTVRSYTGRDGAFAIFELLEFPDEKSAREIEERLRLEVLWGCGAVQWTDIAPGAIAHALAGTEASLHVTDFGPIALAPERARVYLARDGNRLAVLRVLADLPPFPGFEGTASDAAEPDPTADCLVGVVAGSAGAAAEGVCPAGSEQRTPESPDTDRDAESGTG